MKMKSVFNRIGTELLYIGTVAAVTLQSTPAFAQDRDGDGIIGAAEVILELIEGPFGALVMIVAGLVAIVAASMGAYRAAMSALVVAVGSFILRTMVTIFFPDVDLA